MLIIPRHSRFVMRTVIRKMRSIQTVENISLAEIFRPRTVITICFQGFNPTIIIKRGIRLPEGYKRRKTQISPFHRSRRPTHKVIFIRRSMLVDNLSVHRNIKFLSHGKTGTENQSFACTHPIISKSYGFKKRPVFQQQMKTV